MEDEDAWLQDTDTDDSGDAALPVRPLRGRAEHQARTIACSTLTSPSPPPPPTTG